MAPKRFVIFCKDGTTERITADVGDEDEEADVHADALGGFRLLDGSAVCGRVLG